MAYLFNGLCATRGGNEVVEWIVRWIGRACVR